MAKNHIIWKTVLDDKYDVLVEGTDKPSTGILKVLLKGKVLMRAPVFLSYGAIFGPDIMDIESWQFAAAAAVDEMNAKRKK